MEIVKKPVEKPKQEPSSPKKPTPPVTKGREYRSDGHGGVICDRGHTHGSIVAAAACNDASIAD